MDGKLSSNGGNSLGNGASGGAGGSILIQTNIFSGIGTLSANGGFGNTFQNAEGGGGSGGRIAIHFDQMQFNGSISTYGGGGSYPGGPGTIFVKDYTINNTLLIVDNGGNVASDATITSLAATRGSFAWLLEANLSSYYFDEVRISKNAGLAVNGTGISLNYIFYLFKMTSTLITLIFLLRKCMGITLDRFTCKMVKLLSL